MSDTVIDVKDFGAVGDGVTDDTEAIQAAINYVATHGDESIRCFPGYYIGKPRKPPEQTWWYLMNMEAAKAAPVPFWRRLLNRLVVWWRGL